MRRLLRSTSGAEAVELALVMPVFLVLVLGSLQLALLSLVHFEVSYITRETTRWLVVNPDTTDSALQSKVVTLLLPGMTSGDVRSVATSPACSGLSGGHCAGRSSGTPVQVTFNYDASSVVFVPNQLFGFSLGGTAISSQVTLTVE